MKNVLIDKAAEAVRAYLRFWAPALITDEALVAELEGAASSAPENRRHEVIHAYFVAWCAITSAEALSAEGGSVVFRRTAPSEIWRMVTTTDIFASAEFADYASAEASLAAWFDARMEEVSAIIRHNHHLLGPEPDEVLDLIDSWLHGTLVGGPDWAQKLSLLGKTFALLREYFGTSKLKPEVPKRSLAQIAADEAAHRLGLDVAREELLRRRLAAKEVLRRLSEPRRDG